MSVPVYIPNNSEPVFSFLHIFTVCYLLFFDNSHSDSCDVKSHCGFDLHFPDA